LKINQDIEQEEREYRLVSGSDDGYIFFWNISFSMLTEAKAQFYGTNKIKN
jgi:hypothetical protein